MLIFNKDLFVTRKKTQEQFIIDAKRVHGDLYDYSLVKYDGAHTKVIIGCKTHGNFEQIPANHINQARGCPVCALNTTLSYTRKGLEYHLPSLVDIHGDKYDYSEFKYVNVKTKSTVICSCSKRFLVSIEKLKAGRGCPHCAKSGFKPDKPCYLYLHDLGQDCLKVGISTSPKERLTKLKKGYSGEVRPLYKAYFKDSVSARDVESCIKNKYSGNFLSKEELADGFTETFKTSDLPDILRDLCKLCDDYDGVLSEF